MRDARRFWLYVERFWNSNAYVAWLLVALGAALATWAAYSPKSPGVSVGLLALAAGIVSVRPKMHPSERFAWVAVLIALTYMEVNAIRRSDDYNRRIQERQNAEFQSIAARLKTAIDNSNVQYESTIEHVTAVLEQTRVVNGLAERSLRNITGGDAYLTLLPDVAYSGDDMSFAVVNRGRSILAGASLLITSSGAWIPGMRPMMLEQISRTVMLPTMHPEERIIIDRQVKLPLGVAGGDIQRLYITVQGPNFTTEEYLDFRKIGNDSSGKNAWEYKYDVFQEASFRLYRPGQKLRKDTLLERASWSTQWDPMFPIGDFGRALPVDPKAFWMRGVSR